MGVRTSPLTASFVKSCPNSYYISYVSGQALSWPALGDTHQTHQHVAFQSRSNVRQEVALVCFFSFYQMPLLCCALIVFVDAPLTLKKKKNTM